MATVITFMDSFTNFCTWIHKYNQDYSLITPSTFGSYKRFFKSNYQVLSEFNESEIDKNNFHEFMTKSFAHISEISSTKPKDAILVIFNDFMKDLLSKVLVSEECLLGEAEKTILECSITHLNNLPTSDVTNISQTNNTVLQQLQDKIKLLEIQLNANQSTDQLSINATQPRMPATFEEAYTFYRDKYQKLIKYENHVRIFDTHLEQGTCPGNLVWKCFPEPFLPSDPDYINAYNKLIVDFQKNDMNLSKNHCVKRIDMITEELSNMTERFNDISDVSSRVENIKKDVSNSLKQKMDNKFNAILSMRPQFYIVKPLNNNKQNEISPEVTNKHNTNIRNRTNHNNINNQSPVRNRSSSRSRNNRHRSNSRANSNQQRNSFNNFNNNSSRDNHHNNNNVNFRQQSLSRRNY